MKKIMLTIIALAACLFLSSSVLAEEEFVIEDGVLEEYRGSEETVILPDNVTEIGACAFQTSGVKRIICPDNLKKIGFAAFYMSALEEIDVDESVEIETAAFQRCNKMCDRNGFIIVNGVLFDFNESAVTDGVVKIPESVHTIDSVAFEEKVLNEVIVPSTVTEIRSGAFCPCSIGQLIFMNGVTSIQKKGFIGCSISSVTIPESVQSIEEGTFSGHVSERPVIEGATLSEAELFATKSGMQFVPTDERLRGDFNGNGIHDAGDALEVLRMAAHIRDIYGYTADVTEDGQVNAEDALRILKRAAGITTE